MTGTSPIRPARPDDVPVVLSLVRELADYERVARTRYTPRSPDLEAALFGERARGVLPRRGDRRHGRRLRAVVPQLLHLAGQHGIYLEDLYVQPVGTRDGCRAALLMTLVDIARERGYGRVEWSVLDWNVDAQGFYRSIGAAPMDDWTVWRLDGEALRPSRG